MIGMCGYSLCSNKGALQPLPTNLDSIVQTKLENATYSALNVSRDVSFSYTSQIPTWDYSTILNCDYADGVNAGNVDFTLGQLTAIRIRRRKSGDFTWVTIKEIPINSQNDLTAVTLDYFVPSGETFEWALVPILNGGTEGNYIISSLTTKFDGVFIADNTATYKLYTDVGYGTRTSVQAVGTLQPIGSKYPVVIKNSQVDYQSGSVSAQILNTDFSETRVLDRLGIIKTTDLIDAFLKNGQPKVLKDWNGNIWLIIIVGNPSITYNNSYGMGISSTSFEWMEQGKYDNQQDLYDNGLIDIN